MATLRENMTVDEVGEWLIENGFSEEIHQNFERM